MNFELWGVAFEGFGLIDIVSIEDDEELMGNLWEIDGKWRAFGGGKEGLGGRRRCWSFYSLI